MPTKSTPKQSGRMVEQKSCNFMFAISCPPISRHATWSVIFMSVIFSQPNVVSFLLQWWRADTVRARNWLDVTVSGGLSTGMDRSYKGRWKRTSYQLLKPLATAGFSHRNILRPTAATTHAWPGSFDADRSASERRSDTGTPRRAGAPALPWQPCSASSRKCDVIRELMRAARWH